MKNVHDAIEVTVVIHHIPAIHHHHILQQQLIQVDLQHPLKNMLVAVGMVEIQEIQEIEMLEIAEVVIVMADHHQVLHRRCLNFYDHHHRHPQNDDTLLVSLIYF